MVKAVLFGSLSSIADMATYDSEPINRAFRKHGLSLNWTDNAYLSRMQTYGRFTGVDHEREKLGVEDLTEFYADVEINFRSIIDEEPIEAHRCFVESVKALQKKKIRTALVSGADRQTTLRLLSAVFPHRASQIFLEAADAHRAPTIFQNLSEYTVYRAHRYVQDRRMRA